jgi:hypothetical protein
VVLLVGSRAAAASGRQRRTTTTLSPAARRMRARSWRTSAHQTCPPRRPPLRRRSDCAGEAARSAELDESEQPPGGDASRVAAAPLKRAPPMWPSSRPLGTNSSAPTRPWQEWSGPRRAANRPAAGTRLTHTRAPAIASTRQRGYAPARALRRCRWPFQAVAGPAGWLTEKRAVSCGGGRRRRPTSGCAGRSRGAYPGRVATEPPSERGRQPRRPRHFAPYRFARFVLVVLALVGVAALALLVLGLLNVEVVTDHFHIHR